MDSDDAVQVTFFVSDTQLPLNPFVCQYRLTRTGDAPKLPTTTKSNQWTNINSPLRRDVPHLQQQGAGGKQNRILDMMLYNAMSKLPYATRTEAHSILNTALATAAQAEERLNEVSLQLLELRAELKKTCLERNKLEKSNKALRETNRMLEERMQIISRDIQARDASVASYRHALEKLHSHNTTLQTAFDNIAQSNDLIPVNGSVSSNARPIVHADKANQSASSWQSPPEKRSTRYSSTRNNIGNSIETLIPN